jgi:hypothetical protein
MHRDGAFRWEKEIRAKTRARALYGGYFLNTPDEARCIGRFAHTRAVCSCYACGNPRRYFHELPVQERRLRQKERY